VGQAQDVDPLPKVPKWSQLPQDMKGENLGSDVDWRQIMFPPTQQIAPSWVIADDFRSDGRPINGVRWWGSYFNPENQPMSQSDGTLLPTIEDGFIISFFSDIPADPDGTGTPYSRPGALLGSYIADISKVMISPTEMIGWDDHAIWQYEVMLPDLHGDHLIPGLSEPVAFLEQEGVIYWISIAAENGHGIEETTWLPFDTGEPVEEQHFWGWHTSPDSFNDVAVMGDLQMPGGEWLYGNWNPVDVAHGDNNMAFELLTVVPEPSSILMAGIGMVALIGYGWRLRRRGK
jgi:hypothetical protein